MKCEVCEFNYDESSPKDRRRHRKEHDSIVNGLLDVQLRRCRTLVKDGPRTVVVINSESARFERLLAQTVSLIAAGDADYSNLAYAADEPPDERQVHIFLGISDDRAQAYVCFERRSRIWQYTWPEYDRRETHEGHAGRMWTIGYAWTSRGNRKTGWLKCVLDAASKHLGFGTQFAFYEPFTPDGEAAARAICSSSFMIAK